MSLLSPCPKGLEKIILKYVKNMGRTTTSYLTLKRVSACVLQEKTLKIDLTSPTFKINGNILQFVHKHKLVGVIVTSDCFDNSCIARQLLRMDRRSNMLFLNFMACSTDIKIKLFSSHFAVSLYCAQLW